ncbi:malate synthase A, partial [Klebsiella pneumoniae]|nr:malate synthase A [Klebsiella pneumoniae]
MKIEEKRLQITEDLNPEYEEILTKEALQFVKRLERHFGKRRRDLLHLRNIVQTEIDQGKNPDFLKETKHIREESWTAAPI